jgi:hypothetical protein
MWQVKDITLQLVENTPGKETDIILGGGLASFLPYYGLYNNSATLRDYPKNYHIFDPALLDLEVAMAKM